LQEQLHDFMAIA